MNIVPLFFTEMIPADAQAGIWSVAIMIFAADGVTPIMVDTLTFNVT